MVVFFREFYEDVDFELARNWNVSDHFASSNVDFHHLEIG